MQIDLQIFVPGIPVPEPKLNSRVLPDGRIVTYQKTKTSPSARFPKGRPNGFKGWIARVREEAKYAMGDLPPVPAGVALEVTMLFVLPRPVSLTGKKHVDVLPTGRPDLSNLYYGIENAIKVPRPKKTEKMIADTVKQIKKCFNGYVYEDDSQVTTLHSYKRYVNFGKLMELTQSAGVLIVVKNDDGAF